MRSLRNLVRTDNMLLTRSGPCMRGVVETDPTVLSRTIKYSADLSRFAGIQYWMVWQIPRFFVALLIIGKLPRHIHVEYTLAFGKHTSPLAASSLL